MEARADTYDAGEVARGWRQGARSGGKVVGDGDACCKRWWRRREVRDDTTKGHEGGAGHNEAIGGEGDAWEDAGGVWSGVGCAGMEGDGRGGRRGGRSSRCGRRWTSEVVRAGLRRGDADTRTMNHGMMHERRTRDR